MAVSGGGKGRGVKVRLLEIAHIITGFATICISLLTPCSFAVHL